MSSSSKLGPKPIREWDTEGSRSNLATSRSRSWIPAFAGTTGVIADFLFFLLFRNVPVLFSQAGDADIACGVQ